MHSSFSWLGTGAFVQKAVVQRFLRLSGLVELDKTEFQYADMYFSTFLNQAPYQTETELTELPQEHAFSGEVNGIARNKYHMVSYISNAISVLTRLSTRLPSTCTTISIAIARFHSTVKRFTQKQKIAM
jgi:hypothetical protein